MSKQQILTKRKLSLTKQALLYLFLVCYSLGKAADAWEALPPLPEPNGGFFAGTAGDHLILIGGTNWEGGRKNWLQAVRAFSFTEKVWKELGILSVGPRAYGASLQEGSNLTLLGGTDGVKPAKTLIKVLEDHSLRYNEAVALPETISLSSTGEINGEIYTVGGMKNPSDLASITAQVHQLSLPGNGALNVNRLVDFPGGEIATAGSAVLDKRFFIFGGMKVQGNPIEPVNSNEAYVFHTQTKEWKKLMNLPKANRGLCVIALDEDHLYLAGGYLDDTAGFTREAWIYKASSGTYRAATPLPFAAMTCLLRYGDWVYCLGGEDRKQSRTDRFFRAPISRLLK